MYVSSGIVTVTVKFAEAEFLFSEFFIFASVSNYIFM
jgi:hypothetical protein